jgi:hypothetical protein
MSVMCAFTSILFELLLFVFLLFLINAVWNLNVSALISGYNIILLCWNILLCSSIECHYFWIFPFPISSPTIIFAC